VFDASTCRNGMILLKIGVKMLETQKKDSLQIYKIRIGSTLKIGIKGVVRECT
jgi:hypothetical protein